MKRWAPSPGGRNGRPSRHSTFWFFEILLKLLPDPAARAGENTPVGVLGCVSDGKPQTSVEPNLLSCLGGLYADLGGLWLRKPLDLTSPLVLGPSRGVVQGAFNAPRPPPERPLLTSRKTWLFPQRRLVGVSKKHSQIALSGAKKPCSIPVTGSFRRPPCQVGPGKGLDVLCPQVTVATSRSSMNQAFIAGAQWDQPHSSLEVPR